jgi:hypothetical protein
MTNQPVPRARRRAEGIYYTPAEIVAEVVAETLDGPLAQAVWAADGGPELRVLDPAAGDGRFLAACVARIARAAAARGLDAEAASVVARRRCVVGVERDPAAAAVAARESACEVRCADALGQGVIEEGVWDVVVGNPPYVRSVRLREADPETWRRLRGAMAATSYKEWDLYAAFLERALAWARPGRGEIGLVVPSRWLTAAFAGPLRAKLAAERATRKIVDFGARQLFAGATTYVALVYLTRAGADGVDVTREGRTLPRVPAARLGAAPWVLSDDAEKLRGAGPALGDVARIAKGAGTNADPVFLLERRDEGLWSHALGESVEVEPEALVPCVRGRDVEPHRAIVRRMALCDRADPAGPALPFSELATRWPAAARYLARCRGVLEARERGRFRGEAFAWWGRPQNLPWLQDRAPKVIVPDAARQGRAALDGEGLLVIDTAYAIRPLVPDVPIGLILAVLNSPVVEIWLRATGVPLRGDYFRMKTAYLASLPLPDPKTAAAQRVAEDALSGPVDPGSVLMLYGIR